MASFDSYFEEKPTPASKPTRMSGKDFDAYFADEAHIPTEGMNAQPDKRAEAVSGAVREAVQIGLPMLATGGASVLSRPMGIIGKYGLDAAAGVGSEGFLQALGVSEQSPGMLALSGMAGPTGRLLGAAVTGVPKLIPGYRDAARAGLTPHVKDLPGKIIPQMDPDAAYQAVQGNMQTVLPHWPELSATVAKHIAQGQAINLPALKKMTAGGPLEGLMENIEQALAGTPAQVIKQPTTGKGVAFGKPTGLPAQSINIPAQPPGMTFENAKANVEAISKLIRETSDAGMKGGLKDLKRAMLTDLENMPAPPGTPVAQWKIARQAYHDQKTTMLLDDVIEKNIVNREGVEQVNPDGILRALRTNKDVKERLTSGQMTALTNTLKDWASASGGTKSKLAAMLTGMTIGGGPAGALAGWGAAEITSKALMSEGARKMIGNIIANPSVHNIKRVSSMLSAAVRGAFDEPGSTPMPFETTLPKETRTEPIPLEPSAPVPPTPPLSGEDIRAKVTKVAQDTKLDPKLFHAVVKAESNYNPQATSPIGALGLTQLMPKTAAGLGVDPTNIDQNLQGGATYLQSLIKKYNGDVAKALQAYHQGPTAVDKGIKPGPKTQKYVSKILLDVGISNAKERR